MWLVVSVVAVLLTGVGVARSDPPDPLGDLVDPPHVLASVLPTPLADPFYIPPVGFEKHSAGTVLASRTVRNWFPASVRSTELLIRSTDAADRPVPVVATLLVPEAALPGAGPRPLVSYNIPISSLGNTCAPSRQLQEGVQADQVSIGLLLARGYAVVVPDHQGPRQAYAAGRMGGHAVLDALRAAVHAGVPALQPDSPIVLSGYSGGATATGWAAQLAPEYAPELRLAGALIGGVPADYELLARSMDGVNGASGIFLAATLGLAREYPELLSLLNDDGWRLAHAMKDLCVGAEAVLGLPTSLKVERFTNVPDPMSLPWVRKILADNRLGASAPRAPALIYHGVDEFWIPFEQARNLYDDWCARGAQVRLDPLPGEHLAVGALAIPATGEWVEHMFAGDLVPPGCSRAIG
ncbi:lipase family protein [Nocardia blacklockiae]|uniref:lipase family protein n=1 Tax=Nocardia blacklockiae TaxID=480036 RepID=UPI0018931DCB|nr:lipase family protein [Nocardia blacklockiae]MBF6172984.1 lipase [Nocardia blacklockiae]